MFYSSLPLPSAHEHVDIYLQLCNVRWLPRNFNRTTYNYQAATRWDLQPWITIWFIDDPKIILGFCHINLTRETSGFELALTITLVLEANLLTKFTNLPRAFHDPSKNSHLQITNFYLHVPQVNISSSQNWKSHHCTTLLMYIAQGKSLNKRVTYHVQGLW